MAYDNNLKSCMEFCNTVQYPFPKELLWDNISEFKRGIALVQRNWMGNDEADYCIVAFDKKHGDKPYVTRSYNGGMIKRIIEIYVFPEYSTNVKRIIPTGINPVLDQLNSPFSNMSDVVETTKFEPKDRVIEANLEWVIPSIHNEEEARKWLTERGVKGIHLIKSKEVLISKINSVLLQSKDF